MMTQYSLIDLHANLNAVCDQWSASMITEDEANLMIDFLIQEQRYFLEEIEQPLRY